MSVIPLRWVEIPKCDNHGLGLFGFAIRDAAGCGLTVDWLDSVALGGKPFVDIFFKFRKVL